MNPPRSELLGSELLVLSLTIIIPYHAASGNRHHITFYRAASYTTHSGTGPGLTQAPLQEKLFGDAGSPR